MKKRILVFLSVISICLMHLHYNVFADTGNYIYRSIVFDSWNYWEVVAVNQGTFTAVAYLDVPGIDTGLDVNEAIDMYTIRPLTLTKGEPHPTYQHYRFQLTANPEIVHLEISINKLYYNDWCVSNALQCEGDNPDEQTLHLYMSQYFYGYYRVNLASEVIKNFLRAEPNFDNGSLVGNWGEEKYYMYLDAYVYLPDGSKRSITIMPDLIEDYFENYDFVAIAFNLSPRTRFWSPDIYPSASISGLSYIVYDLNANTTTFYDYQGNAVFQKNSITYIDNPQFFVPEMEALDFQLKASYEEGKTEGYKQGREEGIRAGKRQMQEEMQQVIDNLTEYYEEEVRKAYNKGKLEGVNEDFDIFGYLQALFGEQGLGRLLRLELLPGVSLGAVIMIPLAFWLVSFIMRWFR